MLLGSRLSNRIDDVVVCSCRVDVELSMDGELGDADPRIALMREKDYSLGVLDCEREVPFSALPAIS